MLVIRPPVRTRNPRIRLCKAMSRSDPFTVEANVEANMYKPPKPKKREVCSTSDGSSTCTHHNSLTPAMPRHS